MLERIDPGSDQQQGPTQLSKDPKDWPVTEVEITKAEWEVIKGFEMVTTTFTLSASSDLHELPKSPKFVPKIKQIIEKGDTSFKLSTHLNFYCDWQGGKLRKGKSTKIFLNLILRKNIMLTPFLPVNTMMLFRLSLHMSKWRL